MCPILITLGPWGPAALIPLSLVFLAVLLLWQWLEDRGTSRRGLGLARVAVSAAVAAALAGIAYLVIGRFGPIEVKAWGTMLVVAFAAGAFYIARYGDRRVLTPPEVVDMALYCLVGAVIGSRVIFVALDWATYASQPAHILNVWEGGLSYHGGLLGAILAALVFAWRRQKHFLQMADEAAPGIALGYAFARVGCFLNGCCHGHPSDLPWAMVFPHGEINDVPVHPTQLYALVGSLIIMAILIRLKPRVRFPGQLFAAYLAIYSILRFMLEFTRAGATGKYASGGGGLTVAQVASIAIFALGVGYIAFTWRRKRMGADPVAAAGKRRRGQQ